MIADLAELAVSATASGCIYALLALSYLLVLRPTGIINFAVGEWATAGAFVAVGMLTPLGWPGLEWPYWTAIVATVVVLAAIGWIIEVLTIRPLIRRGAAILSPILALLGILVIIREAITLLYGRRHPSAFAASSSAPSPASRSNSSSSARRWFCSSPSGCSSSARSGAAPSRRWRSTGAPRR
jgi:branched-subunit amino acid ABC-type transport system permease component